MSDKRLAELLSQRALLSKHVAWLDAEIARACGSVPEPETPASATSASIANISSKLATPIATSIAATAPSPTNNVDTAESEPEAEPVSEAVALANKRADEIIANYALTDKFNPDSTRRGCLMLAIGVGLIVTAICIGIYLVKYR